MAARGAEFRTRHFEAHRAGIPVQNVLATGPGKALAMRRWLTHFEQGYQPGQIQNAWFGILRHALPSFKPMSGGSNGLVELLISRNPVVAAYAQWEFLAAR